MIMFVVLLIHIWPNSIIIYFKVVMHSNVESFCWLYHCPQRTSGHISKLDQTVTYSMRHPHECDLMFTYAHAYASTHLRPLPVAYNLRVCTCTMRIQITTAFATAESALG